MGLEEERKTEKKAQKGKLSSATSNVLPGASTSAPRAPVTKPGGFSVVSATAPMSLYIDCWGSFFGLLTRIIAACIVGETGKANKACMQLLFRCEDILAQLPPMDVVKLLVAAPIEDERGSRKTRHDKSGVSVDDAQKAAARQLEAASLKVVSAKGEKKGAQKKARAELRETLTSVFPLLAPQKKAELRRTALRCLLDTLETVVRDDVKKEKPRLPCMQKAQIVRTADEDAFFLDRDAKSVHFIVTADGDALTHAVNKYSFQG
jgi:hypothetical protein